MASRSDVVVGAVFGRFTVVRASPARKGYWLCDCQCGNHREVWVGNLARGLSQSCGCLSRGLRSTIGAGNVFGRYTVLRKVTERRGYWECRCACGTVREVRDSALVLGQAQSCGCSRKARKESLHVLHGDPRSFHSAHWYWQMSRQASINGRVPMDEAWFKDLSLFLLAVGRPPEPRLGLGRIDKSQGVVPGNVAWMSSKERQLRKVDKRLVTIAGETKQLVEWADEYGLNETTLSWRLAHWPEDRWLEPPNVVIQRHRRVRPARQRVYKGPGRLTEVAALWARKKGRD